VLGDLQPMGIRKRFQDCWNYTTQRRDKYLSAEDWGIGGKDGRQIRIIRWAQRAFIGQRRLERKNRKRVSVRSSIAKWPTFQEARSDSINGKHHKPIA